MSDLYTQSIEMLFHEFSSLHMYQISKYLVAVFPQVLYYCFEILVLDRSFGSTIFGNSW